MPLTEAFIALLLCPAIVLSQWALCRCLVNREVRSTLINVLELGVGKPCSKVAVTYQVYSECRQRDTGDYMPGGLTNDG